MNTAKLDREISTITEIEGVSIGDPKDKSTWKIHFKGKPGRDIEARVQAVINKFTMETEADKELELTQRNFLLTSDEKIKVFIEQHLAGGETAMKMKDFKDLVELRNKAREQLASRD